MARLLIQANMPYATGLPEDVAVNTWAVDTASVGAPSPTQAAAIFDGLQAFYEAVDEYFSELLSGAIQYRMYNVDDPEPRTPLAIVDDVLPSPGGNPLPEEVALVLSFRGTLVSGTSPARRRGRIYLGPLAVTTLDELDGHAVPNAAMVAAVSAAGAAFGSSMLAEGMAHCVWSRADDTFYPVQFYAVDNAWDTQRRRGVRPTFRSVTSPS